MRTSRLIPRIVVALATAAASALVLAVPAHAAVEDVLAFGSAQGHGSTGALALNAPLVGIAATASGNGYWELAQDGGVFSYGDAAFHGSTGNLRLNKPVVGLGADPRARGYWFVASDGGVFAFDVPFFGSAGYLPLQKPVVGMAATTSGNGYWLVASDGGVFSYGDAKFSGSTGAVKLVQPIVGMAADPDGTGYWFVASDGGVFAFDAPFYGSAAGTLAPGESVVGIAAARSGYWLATSTGRVLPFGRAVNAGDAGTSGRRFTAIAAHPSGDGYWLLAEHPAHPQPAARPQLAFASKTGIWTVNDDGTDLRQISTTGLMPSWSSDGVLLAWEASDHTLFVWDELTGRQSTIPSCESHQWSPDVRVLACNDGDKIVIVDATSGFRSTVAAGRGPVWSPDGSRIAYYGVTPRGFDIFVTDSGGHAIDVTPMDGDQTSPVWSHDSRSIAYEDDTNSASSMSGDIFVVDATGGRSTNISNNPRGSHVGVEARAQAWSSGGLLFDADSGQGSMGPDDWVTKYDAGFPNVRLAHGHDGVWSPDGSQIAFVFGGTVYVMSAGGSDQHAVSPSSGAYSAQWRP